MDISLPDAESTVGLGRQLGRVLNEQYAEGGEQVHSILFTAISAQGKTTFTRGLIEALPAGRMRKFPARALPYATAILRRPPSSIAICTARRRIA